MKCTVKIEYTNGAGNNIFQYVYSRLLAEMTDCNLSTASLPFIDVVEKKAPYNKEYPITRIGPSEVDHLKFFSCNDVNFSVNTYPENYLIYKPHLDKIRSWFPEVKSRVDNDLVFHLRLGDRLLSKRDHSECMRVNPIEYADAIRLFDFDKLHIVTDMKKWGYITEEDLLKMKFHVSVPAKERVPIKQSVDYFNSIVEELSSFQPHVRVNNSVRDDFEFMRSFNQILFQHGTLAWWAATLSNANKVGVFGQWRPIKGRKNKNLGETDFPGWFQWEK